MIPDLVIYANHPRDGHRLELIDFNPRRNHQVCRHIRTGMVEIIPTTALWIFRDDIDGADK